MPYRRRLNPGVRESVPIREAYKLKGPWWLRNSSGAHRVRDIQRANAHLYTVLCENGRWFALDPDYHLWRRPY